MDYDLPEDLIEHIEKSQNEIESFIKILNVLFQKQQPDPYIVLVSLTSVVAFIIERNFVCAEDAEHLRLLIHQTLDAYTNAIIEAGEEIMRGRFGESLFEMEEDEAPVYPRMQ